MIQPKSNRKTTGEIGFYFNRVNLETNMKSLKTLSLT